MDGCKLGSGAFISVFMMVEGVVVCGIALRSAAGSEVRGLCEGG